METIKKLDKKYIVLEVEDLDKYFSNYQRGGFATAEEQKIIDAIPFKKVLMDIDKQRKSEGKSINNEYVVLNQNDPINLHYLAMHCIYAPIKHGAQVKDISVAMVNAIVQDGSKPLPVAPRSDATNG